MSQPMIILYDVPSNVPQPWAPNVWRIRLILNYKRLPYRTCWVEFPDIEQTLRAINAPPTSVRPDGRAVYTLPAILDPTHVSSTTYLGPSGSSSGALPQSQLHPVVLTHANAIADYLEHTYPARPVVPEGTRALQALFVHYITEVFMQPLLPIMLPLSHQHLPLHVQAHFPVPHTASSRRDQVPGDGDGDGNDVIAGVGGAQYHRDAAATARRHEAQWTAVQTQFTFLSRVLDKNACDGDGIVVSGHELTHADFALCAVLIWIEKITPHQGWARVRTWDGGRWLRLWERCKAYMDVF